MKRQYLFHSLRVPIKPYQNKPKKVSFPEKAWANEKKLLNFAAELHDGLQRGKNIKE